MTKIGNFILSINKVNLFFPYMFLALCVFTIVMTLYKTPMDSAICMLVILSGVPVYYLFVKVNKPKSVQDKLGKDISFGVLYSVAIQLKCRTSFSRCIYQIYTSGDVFRI